MKVQSKMGEEIGFGFEVEMAVAVKRGIGG